MTHQKHRFHTKYTLIFKGRSRGKRKGETRQEIAITLLIALIIVELQKMAKTLNIKLEKEVI